MAEGAVTHGAGPSEDGVPGLDPHWVRPLQLAFEALRHGSFPVGAVVRDGSGTVVAEGRNRRSETDAPPRQLAGTALAHAEVNALAQLPSGFYPEHALWTTLEPCLLCTSALRMMHVGRVHFAATDTYWDGVQDLPTVFGAAHQPHWAIRSGPADGLAAVLGGVLPAWSLLTRHPPGRLRQLCVPEPLIELAGRIAVRRPRTFTEFAEIAATEGIG